MEIKCDITVVVLWPSFHASPGEGEARSDLSEYCDSDMGQQSARTTFFLKLLRSHVLRYRDAMKGCPCLSSSGIYQRGLVFIRGSRYAARSEPLPDKACLVGVAGTATHSRVL